MTNQNDTDPQSPRARAARTDPGLGAPVTASTASTAATPLAPAPPGAPRTPAPLPFDGDPSRVKPLTPVPAASSIETLLDGITGPRPALAKAPNVPRMTAQTNGENAAVFQGAHAIASRHPTPPIEPLVMMPDPSSSMGGILTPNASAVTTRLPRRPDGSIRPTVQRAQDTTVYTTRKAMLRNTAAVVLSGVVVAALLFTFVRWNDARRGAARRAEEAQASPPPAAMDLSAAHVEATAVSAPAAAPEPSHAVASAEPAAAAVGAPSASVSAPAAVAAQGAPSSARRRAPVKAAPPVDAKKPALPPTDDLDDLNRQIRH